MKLKPAAPLLAILLVAVVAVVAYSSFSHRPYAGPAANANVVPFQSAAEFTAYLEDSRAHSASTYSGWSGTALGGARTLAQESNGLAAPAASDSEKTVGAGEGASRVSESRVAPFEKSCSRGRRDTTRKRPSGKSKK